MQEDFDQEDPFKKYGGSELKQQEDPFKKYGGSAIQTPSKKKESTDWVSKTFGSNQKNGGQVGTSVPQLQENKKVVKTPQEKLKNLGIDVTFEKEDDSPKILIEAPKNKFANGIPQPFPNKPTYIDLTNPESLAYLSSKIKEGKDNADPTKYGLFMSDEQKAKYRPKAAKEKIAEADELMQEVSQQASQNAFNKTISKIQPSLIDRKHLIETGLEYLKQVDPAQYKRNMTILEAGEDLGDENKYNLEKTGGAILEKNLPFVTGEEYDLNNISNLNALTDKAHPDIAIAKGWDIIGAYNHKKDNRANGGWNRTRPTVGQAKKWIEEPELLEMFKGNEVALDEIKKKLAEMPEEVNNFKIDEVPVGGLFNNLGRAILGSAENVGNIFRGDVKRQQSNLNPTLGRGTLTGNYRDPGESPALLQQLYSLEAAEKDGTITEPEKQQLKVLRSNTKVRDGWDKFADGTGNLSGQVIAQVLLTKGAGLGTGTVGKLASLSKATQTTINASIGTALNSYDQTRQQAVYNFPDDKVKQAIYTGVMVAANVASERIFKDEKVFDAFKKELQGDIVNYVKNLSAQNINRAAIKKLVTEKLLKFGGQTLKESNKEGFEEAIVQAVDEAMQSSMGAEGYDGDKAMGRIGDTYATTMLYGAPVGALAAKSNMAADKFNRVQIYRMSKDPATFQKEIQRQYEAGEITNQERQEKLGVLGMAAQIAAAEPPKVAALPTKKKAEYLTQQLNIAINEGILDGAKDPNQQEELKANIAESQKRAKAIYESEPEVLEEIVQPKQNIETPQTDDQWKERIAAAETEEEKDAIMREHGDWLMKQGKNDETFLKDQSLSTPNNLIERLGSEEAVIETIAKNKKEDIKGALKAWTANMQAAEPDSQEYHEAEAHVALLEAGLEKAVEAPTQEGVGKEQVFNEGGDADLQDAYNIKEVRDAFDEFNNGLKHTLGLNEGIKADSVNRVHNLLFKRLENLRNSGIIDDGIVNKINDRLNLQKGNRDRVTNYEYSPAIVKLSEKQNREMEGVGDKELYDKIGKDGSDYIKKSETQLGDGVIDRNRVIKTAEKIAKLDGKSKVDIAAIAEAVHIELAYENKFDDLRKAGEKETVQRMIDVGVDLPKDIVDKFKKEDYDIKVEKGEYGTQSYDLKSGNGKVSGHIGEAYDWKNNKKGEGKEISVARIDAKEIGKGQGEELLKSVIDYANKNGIKYIGSTSLNEASRKTFEKLEKQGFIKSSLEGVNNKTITWEISKEQSLSTPKAEVVDNTTSKGNTSNVVEAGSGGVGGDVDAQYNERKKSIEDKLNQQLEDNKDRLDDIDEKGGTKTVRQKIYQEHTNDMVELEKWKMKEDLKKEDTPDGRIKKNSEFSSNQLTDAIPNSEVHYENKEDNGVTTITLRDKNTKKHIASIDIGTGDTIDGYAGVRIQVNGEHQGKGLSKHLYNLALTEAKKQGLKGLYTIDEMLKTPDKTIATRDNFVTRKNTDEKLKTQARKKYTNVADPNITFIENVSDKFIKKGATKLSEQSLSKQESGGKAPVTKPEGKSDVVVDKASNVGEDQQKAETKRVEKVAELEAERDMAILREKVPEMGNVNEVVPTREAVSAGSSADNLTVNKRKRAELKNRYTELQKLLGCLMK